MKEEKKQEKLFTEAEVSETGENNQETSGKRKTDYYIELALFLILGILIGVAVKTEAVKRVTIGVDDYRMKIASQDYNINQLQKDLAKKQADQLNQQNNPAGPGGAADNSGQDQTGNLDNSANPDSQNNSQGTPSDSTGSNQ